MVEFVSCKACPLRSLPVFLDQSSAELSLIEALKKEQIVVAAEGSIIDEGQANPPLFTLLSGWAFRYKTLSDGRRQILNFLLPGDFIGVQQRMSDAAAHGVQALTEVILCVFRRDALWELHRSAPALGFGTTWLLPEGQQGDGVPFPLTQQHMADGLGLSLVHTNKTLRKLERRGLHQIKDGRLRLVDVKALARIADLYGDGKAMPRPLI
jgi:CRP/FNR family transcriptional regulator, anaerobic regulatory protein